MSPLADLPLHRSRSLAALLTAWLIAVPAAASEVRELVLAGDAAWNRRAAGSSGPRAGAGPVGEAVAAYRAALAASPRDLGARWKLLRALAFLGEHATADAGERRRLYLEARDLAEEGLDLLARTADGRERLDRLSPAEIGVEFASVREAPALYFWAAIHWGLWARDGGTLAAARRGVARRVRDYASAVIALDPRFEEGGGHRILGRLHAEAPRIPLFTGWIDRDRAVAELEAALERGPSNPRNRLFLAEALLEHRPRERRRALALLRDVAAMRPRSRRAVEDAAVIAAARALLDEVR